MRILLTLSALALALATSLIITITPLHAKPARAAKAATETSPAPQLDLLPTTAWRVALRTRGRLGRGLFEFGRPLAHGDMVFAAAATGGIFGISDAGKIVWQAKTEGPVYAPLAIADDLLYAADAKGFAYALHRADGREEWRAEIGSEIMARPLPVGDRLYLATARGELIAVHRGTGATLWRTTERPMGAQFLVKGAADPLLVNGQIVVGYGDGHFVGHDPKNGVALWDRIIAPRTAILHDVDMTPVIVGSQAIVAAIEGGLTAIDLRTQLPLWRAPLGTPNDALLDGNRLYVTAGGNLHALNARTGHVLWKTPLSPHELSAPVLVRGHLVTTSTTDTLYLIDPTTGTLLASRPMGKGTYGRLTVHGTTAYVMTNAHHLVALRFE